MHNRSARSISLVFPMYNEKDYLPVAVEKARKVLGELTDNYEVIIVDDASTDGSGEMARELARNDEKIRVLRHKKNSRLGCALKTGFNNARGGIVVYSDMDLPFDLENIKRFIPLLDEADIVVGRRIGSRDSLLRSLYSKAYNGLIRAVFGIKVSDVNFAMKIFKRDILDLLELKSDGSFIDAELLIRAVRLGYIVKEVEVAYRARQYGVSHLCSLPVIFKIIAEMVKLLPELKGLSRERMLYIKAKRLYKGRGFKVLMHNAVRYHTCPFGRIIRLLPEEGKFLDLGCGNGFFTNIIAIGGKRRNVAGIDIDKRKIDLALALRGNSRSAEFLRGDLASPDFMLPDEAYDCITLVDALYLLPYPQQEGLLRDCFDSLSPGGILIIKEMAKRPMFKFLFNLIQETISVKIVKSTMGGRFYFRKEQSYLGLLKEIGFNTQSIHSGSGYLHPHLIFLSRKP
ncbi:MAG: glycosyltransferase [Candidatus Omnitrophica bacterium]|nr:glycosyltransferase [Candidatus Omnitrophota bacterium]